MSADRNQWQFPKNETGKILAWSNDSSPSNASAALRLVNKTAASIVDEGIPSRLTFRQFGAVGDGVTDDSTAINDAAEALRDALNSGENIFAKYIDGEGLIYKHDSSLNFTAIKGRMGAIIDASFISHCTGKIALDFTGSQNLWLDRLTVTGDATDIPAVGFFFARIDDGGSIPYPTAQSINCGFIEYLGTFSKAGLINAASEVFHADVIKGSNNYYSNLATCSIFAGDTDVIANYCGMPTSDYQDIGLGSQSLSSVIIDNHNPQRGPAYGYTITGISKANPAVVTISSANAVAGAASFGLANGASIFLDSVLGTNDAWQAQLSFKTFTVANLNTAAGTFELSGVDTSATTGTFTSGILRNDTGPATVLGQASLYREGGGYQVAYSDAHYRLDVRGNDDWNWIVELCGRHETAADHLVKIIGDGHNNIIRHLKFISDNSTARVSPFSITGVAGTGDISIYNLEVILGHNAQTPTLGLFDDASDINLYGGRICVPGVDWVNARSAFKFSSASWEYGTGFRRTDGPVDFYASGTGAAALRVQLDEDGAAAGPFLDLYRNSASPAVADSIGDLRWLANDSGGTATAFAFLRGRLNDPTDTSEDARLSVFTRTAGAASEGHYFEGGVFRYVVAYTVATLPAGTVGSTAFATDLRVFNGAGTQEGAGVGTGGLVTHNGTAWKIAGTNVTAVA